MQNITNIQELKIAIKQLEDQKAEEWPTLKAQLLSTYENLKPLNMIKNTLTDLITGPNFKDGILDTTLSLAAGYITKKTVVGNSYNPIKQLFGLLLQMGVTNIVSKNTDKIKSTAAYVIHNIFNNKKTIE